MFDSGLIVFKINFLSSERAFGPKRSNSLQTDHDSTTENKNNWDKVKQAI